MSTKSLLLAILVAYSCVSLSLALNGGTTEINFHGKYGEIGVNDGQSQPPGLFFTAHAKDKEGRFYMFGGRGRINDTSLVECADLWRFDGYNWELLFRNTLENDPYSLFWTQGEYDPENKPSDRYGAAIAVDSQGIVWLYGGYGYGSWIEGVSNCDLWKFNGSQWMFVDAGDTMDDDFLGIYEDQGSPSFTSYPPSKFGHAMWVDDSDNIWLYGGYLNDSFIYGDVWMYDGTLWTWVRDGNETALVADGTEEENTPGKRYGMGYDYYDKHLYIYGGLESDEFLGDLWKFNGSVWTHLSGVVDFKELYPPRYEYEIGVQCGNCTPGARTEAALVVRSENSILVGYGVYLLYDLRDLWQFNGSCWTWIAGYDDRDDSASSYLAEGVADVTGAIFPTRRTQFSYWGDDIGNLWLYGGLSGFLDAYGDLWVLLVCEASFTGTIEFDANVSPTSRICGYRSNLTGDCDTLEKAASLAYVCKSQNISVNSAYVNISEQPIPFTLLGGYSVVPSHSLPSSKYVFDFSDVSNETAGIKFTDDVNAITIIGCESVFRSSHQSYTVSSSSVFFENCTFTSSGVDSSKMIANSIVAEGSSPEITLNDCMINGIMLGADQTLFSVARTQLNMKNVEFKDIFVNDGTLIHAVDNSRLSFVDIALERCNGELTYVSRESRAEMAGMRIIEYNTGDSALIIVADHSEFAIENATVVNGTEFVRTWEKSTVALTNATFSNLSGTDGTVVNANDANVVVKDSRFEKVSAEKVGGVFKTASSTTSLDSSEFSEISALFGAIIFADLHSDVTMNKLNASNIDVFSGALAAASFFTNLDCSSISLNNVTAKVGGALYVDSYSSATLRESTMAHINVTTAGLANIKGSSNAYITGFIFEHFYASNQAGAVYIDGFSTVNSTGNVFRGMHSETNGGVIVNYNTLDSEQDKFEQCHAQISGGVLYGQDSEATFVDAEIVNNQAAGSGGSVYMEKGTLSLYNVSVSNSISGDKGGGIYASDDARVYIYDSEIVKSTAVSGGGGVYVKSDDVSIISSYFAENEAEGDGVGGALLIEPDGNLVIGNSTFEGNKAKYGGGIFLVATVGDSVSCCNFTANLATSGGGGIFMLHDPVNLENSTFSSNAALYGKDKATTARSIHGLGTFNTNSNLLDLGMDFTIFDYYNNTVRDSQERRIKLNSTLQLVGSLQEAVENGSCVFNDTGVIHTPGTAGELKLHLEEDLMYAKYVLDTSNVVGEAHVNVLNCSDTEIVQNDVCSFCLDGQYVKRETRTCATCPLNARCNGTHMIAAEGFWGVPSDEDRSLYKCPLENACSGGVEYGKCNDGYTGVVCATCAEDYGPVGQACIPCGNMIFHYMGLPLATFIVLLVLLAAAFYFTKKSSGGGSDSGASKILFNYIQTISILVGLITVREQQVASGEMLGLFSAFSLDTNIISLQCIVKLGYVHVLFLFTALSVVILVLPLLAWVPVALVELVLRMVRWVLGKQLPQFGWLQSGAPEVVSALSFSNRYRNMFLILLHSLLLPRAAGHVAAVFACVRVEDQSYLANDYNLVCYTLEYYLVVAYGVCFFATFVLGSLAFLLAGMTTIRICKSQLFTENEEDGEGEIAEVSKAYGDKDNDEQGSEGILARIKVLKQYSPLLLPQRARDETEDKHGREIVPKFDVVRYIWYVVSFFELESAFQYYQGGYKDFRFFWEILISIRKILILSAVVYSNDVVMKTIVIIFILLLFSFLHVIVLPFKRRIDNFCEFMSLLAAIWVAASVLLHEMYVINMETYTRDLLLVFLFLGSVVIPVGSLSVYSLLFSNRYVKVQNPLAEDKTADSDADIEMT